MFAVQPLAHGYEGERLDAIYARTVEALESQPGVVAVGSSPMPLGTFGFRGASFRSPERLSKATREYFALIHGPAPASSKRCRYLCSQGAGLPRPIASPAWQPSF